MDAPYEADDWGEVVRMDRITNLLYLACILPICLTLFPF
jgi:hypothetical protein